MPSVYQTLSKRTVNDTPPIWFMRQAGRYLPEYRKLRASFPSFLDFCYDPEAACEATVQPITRFGLDAAILFSDILVIPHALGMDVQFIPGKGPVMTPIETVAQLEKLNHIDAPKIYEKVWKAVSLIRSALPRETDLIGFCGAPWTVACYMVEGGSSKDYATVRRMGLGNPDLFQAIIDVLVEESIRYLRGQADQGAQILKIFDSWSGVLTESEFKQWVIQPNQRIVEALHQSHPAVPIITFPRKAGWLAESFVDVVKPDGLALDSQVNRIWAKETLGQKTVLQGNLDPLFLLENKELALKEARHIREDWFDIPFIFNLGHGMTPDMPIAHVEALVEALRTPL